MALPPSLQLPHRNPIGLFLTEASIVAPESSVLFAAMISAPRIFVGGFRLPMMHHYIIAAPIKLTKTENTASLGALTRFIHRGKNRNSSNIDPNERFSLVGI